MASSFSLFAPLFLKFGNEVVKIGSLLDQMINLFSDFGVLSQGRVEVGHYTVEPAILTP